MARASSALSGWREAAGKEAASFSPISRSSVSSRLARSARVELAPPSTSLTPVTSPAGTGSGTGVARVRRSISSQLTSRARSAASAAPPPLSPNRRLRHSSQTTTARLMRKPTTLRTVPWWMIS